MLLLRIEVIDGIAGTGCTGRLDLDHDAVAAQHHDKVDLATTGAHIALENASTPLLQEFGCYVLAETAALAAAQIAEVGSSSSMLTSRNVITLTLLTNLAGRYMSHTHASFNSSSK